MAIDSKGRQHPSSAYGPTVDSLPSQVAAAYREVRDSMSASSYASATMMCRRILMHVAVEQGAEEGKPFAEYVDDLRQLGLVTSATQPWVDEIRTLGNVANHSIDPVERQTAESAVMFVAQLLRNVYEVPEQHRRLTASTATP